LSLVRETVYLQVSDALGSVVFAPLSELYGRLYIYWATNILFVAFNVGCALAPTLSSLIVFQFLAGCSGSAPLTIGGGTIADLTSQDSRGVAMALYAMGSLLGPAVGPVCGGFLADAKGWRWVFWILAMVSGFNTLVTFILMRETYATTILQRRTERLRKETGNPHLRSELGRQVTPSEMFKLSLTRPLKLLMSPIVFFLSLYTGIVYAYIYLLLTTFPEVFQTVYEFSSGLSGLAYLGIGFGFLFGAALTGYISDRLLKYLSRKGEQLPEYR
jgi:multidrug resistance protein